MSYLELYQIWLAEDLEENEGCETIFAEHILNYLVVQKIINKDEENFVRLSSKTFDKNQVSYSVVNLVQIFIVFQLRK